MFHHTSSSTFGTMSRTAGRTMIHNDENAMHNTPHRQHKKGGGLGRKGGGLKPQNININNTPSTNVMVTKTPLNKQPTSSKRRALGDISNRKGTNNGNGNGGAIKIAGAKGASRNEFSIYTPHKQGGLRKSTSVLANKTNIINPAKNVSVKETKKQYRQSTKKKAVSFSFHEPRRDTSKESTVPVSVLRPSKINHQNQNKPVQKSKASRSLRQRENFEVEDIELSAGRTGDEERDLLGEDELSIPSDVQQAIDDIRAIKQMKREEKDLIIDAEYEDFIRQTDLGNRKAIEGLQIYEEVEETSYFEHIDSLLYRDDEDELSLALGYDVDDIISCIDDISI